MIADKTYEQVKFNKTGTTNEIMECFLGQSIHDIEKALNTLKKIFYLKQSYYLHVHVFRWIVAFYLWD